MYCNRKQFADCQTLIDSDILTNLSGWASTIKCPYEILRTEWTDDSVALQDGIDNMISWPKSKVNICIYIALYI